MIIRRINFKGIISGIITATILTIFVSFVGYFLEHTISTKAENYKGSLDYINEGGLNYIIGHIKFQPALFLLDVISIIVIVFIPAYVCARVANQQYILHAILIGAIYLTIPFILEGMSSMNAYDLLLFSLILPISYFAGYICKRFNESSNTYK